MKTLTYTGLEKQARRFAEDISRADFFLNGVPGSCDIFRRSVEGDTVALYGARPAFTLPSSIMVDDGGNVITNQPPSISGSDSNLGDKNADFELTYYVNDQDAGDSLTVSEKLDGATTKAFTAARLTNYTLSIPVSTLALGSHTAQVTVSDGKASESRTWTFNKTNSPPVISGIDGDLGDKNLAFSIGYTVSDPDGNALTVKETLNGEPLRTVSNAPHGQELTLAISAERLLGLTIGSVNTILIEANDGNGGVSYRSWTFTRTNSAPEISGADTELGLMDGPFSHEYIVNDAEGDGVTVTEYIDGKVIRSYEAVLGRAEEITLSLSEWLVLANEPHTLRIEAAGEDGGAVSVRMVGFAKNETIIDVYPFPAPCETDELAKKLIFTPSWVTEGSDFHVFACNNAFDEEPAWEDITPQVVINRTYHFINDTFTADRPGVDIRVLIEKHESYDGTVSFSGYGGAFE